MQKKSQQDDCSDCSVKVFCLPVGLNDSVVDQLSSLVKHKQILHKGDYLFKAEQKLEVLYVIRSGSFKTFQQIKNSEHIINFNLPGEVLGFNALSPDNHQLYAQALETSSVCEISFDNLLQLASKGPSIQKRLLALACKRQEKHSLFTLTSSAIERVSAFLLNLSSRFKKRGLSAQKFNLSLPRQDIANYLGLTNETTRIMFIQIIKEGAITLENRQVDTLDSSKLRQYATLN